MNTLDVMFMAFTSISPSAMRSPPERRLHLRRDVDESAPRRDIHLQNLAIALHRPSLFLLLIPQLHPADLSADGLGQLIDKFHHPGYL